MSGYDCRESEEDFGSNRSASHDWDIERSKLRAENAKLLARVAALEQALRPFAELAERTDNDKINGLRVDGTPVGIRPSSTDSTTKSNLGHCRAARVLLGSNGVPQQQSNRG